MNRGAWILGALLVFVLGFGGYSIYTNLEKVESKEFISFEGEARDNPLLAARIFLNRMGLEAEMKDGLHSLAELPSVDTTLIISAKRSSLSKEKIEGVYKWVERGGHLITQATNDSEFVDFFEMDDEKGDYSIGDKLQAILEVETASWETLSEGDQQHIYIKGAKKRLELDIGNFLPIYADDEFLDDDELITLKVDGEAFVFILRRKIGNGMITLVSDLSIIDNRDIRNADHAEVLWQLVNVNNVPRNIWLIANDELPALWEILWKHASALVMSLILLLLTWLYAASHRFGPLIPNVTEDRRSLLEHIQASGNFYWQHQQKQTLIDSSRAALETRLNVVYPSWQQLSKEEKIRHLSARFGIPQDAAHKLLFAQNVALKKTQADDFTALVKQLEEIRNSI